MVEGECGSVGRVVMYDYEALVEVDAGHTLVTGDLFMVYRGNGPREGDLMGTAIVTGFKDGGAILRVHKEGWKER